MENKPILTDAYFAGKNLWAVILGGSSGIGLATAQKLASEGMNLAIVHRDRKKQAAILAEQVLKMEQHGVQVKTYNLDATKTENRTHILESLSQELRPEGKIKLMIHAISRGTLKALAPDQGLPLENQKLLDPSDFQITLQSMALSMYDWVKSIHTDQLFAEDARIIGLTSEGGERAIPNYGAVSVAKGALEALCRSIALEYAPHGIRCNVIQAGVTDTPSLQMIPGSDQLKRQSAQRNPFKRLTEPQDVANMIYLLSRKESAWVNGAIIPVDGGERIA